jgi:hypothetical protein
VEEIDRVLVSIASRNQSSSELLKKLAVGRKDDRPITELHEILNRLQPREVKWLTRLLLKNTGLVTVPADFAVSSYQTQLPNCVTVHVGIPKSTPPVLQLGGTGTVRASGSTERPRLSPIKEPITPLSQGAPQRSSGNDMFRSDRGRRSRRDLKTLKRDISKPRSFLKLSDGPVPSLSTPASVVTHPIPAVDEISSRWRTKRRRTVRHVSPNALMFQRGVLQPLRPTSITTNLSLGTTSASSHSQKSTTNSDHPICSNENTTKSAFWVSSGLTQDPAAVIFEDDGPRIPKSATPKRNEDFSPVSHPETPWGVNTVKRKLHPRNELRANEPLAAASKVFQTPTNSDQHARPQFVAHQAPIATNTTSLQTSPHSRPRRSKNDATHNRVAAKSKEPTPRSAAVSPSSVRLTMDAHPVRLSTKADNSQIASPSECVARISDVHPSPRTRICTSTSLIKAGGRACNLGTATCPLINCIFLVPDTLPSIVKSRLITNLLPQHACTYLTSIIKLADNSLPRRCPVTSRKIRKIVLIEPRELEESRKTLTQVEGLKLTRSQNRKVWVECFDWRLLEGISRRELEIEGSGANPWKRYWMCAV